MISWNPSGSFRGRVTGEPASNSRCATAFSSWTSNPRLHRGLDSPAVRRPNIANLVSPASNSAYPSSTARTSTLRPRAPRYHCTARSHCSVRSSTQYRPGRRSRLKLMVMADRVNADAFAALPCGSYSFAVGGGEGDAASAFRLRAGIQINAELLKRKPTSSSAIHRRLLHTFFSPSDPSSRDSPYVISLTPKLGAKSLGYRDCVILLQPSH